MKNIKRFLRILGFLCLFLLALIGVGIPIPYFPDESLYRKDKTEQIDEDKIE